MTDGLPALELVGAAIGEGAGDSGCKYGAQALREFGVLRALHDAGTAIEDGATVVSNPLCADDRLGVVEDFSPRLAAAVEGVIARGRFPLVIGGDHSCAVGTWSGVAQAIRPQGALGLVWIDAHLDAHTPETSETQAPHGMPLAALMGQGRPGLTDVYGWRGKLRPEHLVIIGARSYEVGERALLEQLGVRVMYMPEVQERGFAACFQEARARVRQGTAGWGISFDVDALDPADAPGTGTPVDTGIRLDDALRVLESCIADPQLKAFELAEYNPLRDLRGRTARAVSALLTSALTVRTALAARRPAARSRASLPAPLSAGPRSWRRTWSLPASR